MKTITFTQNIGGMSNLMNRFRLPESTAKLIAGKQVGDTVEVTKEVADQVKAAMPGGVQVA